VGFTHGWQAMAVMVSQARAAHAKRLGQAQGIRMTLRGANPDGRPQTVYMQLDGEPWRQEVPSGPHAPAVVVEVSLVGKARVLTNVHRGEVPRRAGSAAGGAAAAVAAGVGVVAAAGATQAAAAAGAADAQAEAGATANDVDGGAGLDQ
jgi:hypothetical protein